MTRAEAIEYILSDQPIRTQCTECTPETMMDCRCQGTRSLIHPKYAEACDTLELPKEPRPQPGQSWTTADIVFVEDNRCMAALIRVAEES